MTYGKMKSIFDSDDHDDEYLKFDRIENKRSTRPDIHAFILLNELVGGTSDMVSAAEHDEIYLDVNVEELAKAINEGQIVELMRCGVRLNDSWDCLAMFV